MPLCYVVSPSSFPIDNAEEDRRRADYIDKDREEVRKSIQEAPESYKKTSAYLGIFQYAFDHRGLYGQICYLEYETES